MVKNLIPVIEEEKVWKSLYICPFCRFKTRTRELMREHVETHLKEERKNFNPSKR